MARGKLEELDVISQRYGVLPSTFLNKSIIELQFDMLVASAGIDAEVKAAKKHRIKGRHGK